MSFGYAAFQFMNEITIVIANGIWVTRITNSSAGSRGALRAQRFSPPDPGGAWITARVSVAGAIDVADITVSGCGGARSFLVRLAN